MSDFRHFPSSFHPADISLGEQTRPDHLELFQEELEPLHIMCNSSQSKKINDSYN